MRILVTGGAGFIGSHTVGESVVKPLGYYDSNVNGMLTLLRVMHTAGCKNIILPSSATVCDTPDVCPTPETQPKHEVTNPYGRTKSHSATNDARIAHVAKESRKR